MEIDKQPFNHPSSQEQKHPFNHGFENYINAQLKLSVTALHIKVEVRQSFKNNLPPQQDLPELC